MSDKEETHIVKQKSGKEWRVLGMADIDDVNEIIGMDIPGSKDYDTFSGYVLNKGLVIASRLCKI